MAPQEA